jgi:hypothetical protein
MSTLLTGSTEQFLRQVFNLLAQGFVLFIAFLQQFPEILNGAVKHFNGIPEFSVLQICRASCHRQDLLSVCFADILYIRQTVKEILLGKQRKAKFFNGFSPIQTVV